MTTPIKAADGTVYTCPMHPEIQSDIPGNCPKCGMFLVPEDKQAAKADGHGHGHHSH